MIRGCLVGESLQTGTALELPPDVHLDRVARQDRSAGAAPDEPAVWTVIDFHADSGDGEDLAQAFAAALEAQGGWYADFRVDDEHVVVFAGKIFRYHRGDTQGRARAQDYGRSVGVPEEQLDWDD